MSQVISDYAQITRLASYGTLPAKATTLTLTPGVSSQPVNNGEVTFDYPRNYILRMNAKGTDGQVRNFIGVALNNLTNSLAIGDVGNIFYNGGETIAAWDTVVIGQQAASGVGVAGTDRLTDTVVIGAYAGNKFKHGNGNAICGNRSMQDIVNCSHNTAYGDSAWRFATSGTDGTAVGYCAGQEVLALNGDVVIGSYAACYANASDKNVVIGFYAGAREPGSKASIGSQNVMIGYEAMRYSLGSVNNIGIGNGVLYLATGSENVAIGHQTCANMTGSTYNVVLGAFAAQYVTSSVSNILIGFYAGAKSSGTTGAAGTMNIGIGDNAIRYSAGDYNIGIGGQALFSSTGGNNVAIGQRGGDGVTTGSKNTFIGTYAGYSSGSVQMPGAIESIAIGYAALTTKSYQVVLGRNTITETVLRGKVQWNPPVSATPDGNGQITFEFTDNNTITLKGRGLDGTVRSVTLTLA